MKRFYFYKFTHLFLGVVFLMRAQSSYALISEVAQYVSQYQIGIDYTNSNDQLDLSYTTPSGTGSSKYCSKLDEEDIRCSVPMEAASFSGFGIFLQKAFKKQGFWYFDYDIGFGVRYLQGSYTAADQSEALKQAKFSLASVVGKPYIQFGVTPQSLPDLLISMGPAAQVAIGKMTINDASKSVAFGTSSYTGPMSLLHGFIELEIVLKRFGDGAFSVFSSSDLTGSGEGTKLFPSEVDGMSDFKGVFSHKVGGAAFGFGLKLVTTFP